MITQLELGITDGVSVSLVSINVWRLAGDTFNITCNFLYCSHQVHRDFLITLYNEARIPDYKESHVYCTVAGYTSAGLASSSRLPKGGGVLTAAI
jgi:hypothetical protein